MKKSFIVLILFSGLSNTGLALADDQLIGTNLSHANERDYPSVCNITVFKSDGTKGLCSGTLVSNNKVFTAGHCFGRDYDSQQKVTITCGGQLIGNAGSVNLPNTRDNSLWTNSQDPTPTADFATINLMFSTHNAPSAVAKGPQAYFNAQGDLLPGVNCNVMGYGYTDIDSHNYNRQSMGSLISANLSDVQLVYTSVKLLVTLSKDGGPLPTSVNGGDSGGPLFCTAPNQSPELVGVSLSYTVYDPRNNSSRRTNIFAPVWEHLSP